MDDNGSEEDFSYEDLCRANPRYLQPGGEQLAINEVLGSTRRRLVCLGLESTPTCFSGYFLANIV